MAYSIYESINSNQAFPANVFVTSVRSSTYHWHKEYEIVGILQGSITMNVSSETVVLKEGDVYLVNSNVIHAIKGMEQSNNLCVFIQIDKELFQTRKDEKADICFFLDSTQEEEPTCGFRYFFQSLARIAAESLEDNPNRDFRIRAQICTLIADLFDYVVHDLRFSDSSAADHQELTAAVIAYLEQHLDQEKVLEQACRQFGMSRKSLDRNLKITIGVTGKEILENLQVEKAKYLLKNTDSNMNYILDVCGFGSEKTFYRVFRNETGVTPKEFRRNGKLEVYDATLKGYLDYETAEVKKQLQRILKEA